jgi:hypothetical protein
LEYEGRRYRVEGSADMSADRPVHTDALATLGTIIADKQGRDAIHLAVEPTIAKQILAPSQPVGVDGTDADPVGIVDPFLKGFVHPGERFWLILFPRQITSLRHVWEHPAFPSVEPKLIDRPYSEKWMRAWAMKHMSDDYYDDLGKVSEQEAYEFAINAGKNMSVGPHESARDYIDNEWWGHWEAITGQEGKRGEYFSCGC